MKQSWRWLLLTPLSLVLSVAAVGLGVLLWMAPPNQPQASAAPTPLVVSNAAGYQTTEKLFVNVLVTNKDQKDLEETLVVELLDPEGKILHTIEKAIKQKEESYSYRIEFPSVHGIGTCLLRCQLGEKKFEAPMSKIMLVKAHETGLAGNAEFHAGSPAALRLSVHGVKSIAETIPHSGANVEVKLIVGGKEQQLFNGKTAGNGMVEAEMTMPKVDPGTYKLQIVTKSEFGEEKIERDVRIKSEPKILLITDKPLYQPGQVMHIRALSLRPFDLSPVHAADLVFEVEDPKGNKVFKRTFKTSEHGIASVDFQLADEVNMGDYQVRAKLGDQQTQKTVAVKKYVLPKFKVGLTTDKKYYMPKEVVAFDVQSDYFFGKPVSKGKIELKASTFDVAFKDFFTWKGETDAKGHAQVEIKLPDYFVGQPLQKGDAIVKFEVKLTDSADHTETVTKTVPVSDKAIRVSIIPEGGRLIPNVKNRLFAAAIYPDGSPASGCTVNLWTGQQAKGEPIATVRTNEAGLAEFNLMPDAKQFRVGEWGQRELEMVGGQKPQDWGPQPLFDLFAEASDGKGSKATAHAALNSELLGENVLLRLDKAIYRGGDTINVDIQSSAGLPTVYLDIVKGGQTLLTKWLNVVDGKATDKVHLPQAVFGTLEVHAYQMLSSGEIIRDSRVIYASPRDELKIDVQADRGEYLPGKEGKITFSVTDAQGKPAPAALGVVIVDEAVYALQDMQPGLEKVYFTLQEELLKPQAQVVYKPSEPLDQLVIQPALPEAKQQIAQCLLAPVRPKPPARWEINPEFDRRQKALGMMQQFGWAFWNSAHQPDTSKLFTKRADGQLAFHANALNEVIRINFGDANQPHVKEMMKDPFGGQVTLESLAALEPEFTATNLVEGMTQQKMQDLYWNFIQYSNQHQAKFLKDKEWTFPETALLDALRFTHTGGGKVPANQLAQIEKHIKTMLVDKWGNNFKLVKRAKKLEPSCGQPQFDQWSIVSAGPDGKFDTKDDIHMMTNPNEFHLVGMWWLGDSDRTKAMAANQQPRRNRFGMRGGELLAEGGERFLQRGVGGPGGGGPVPAMAPMAARDLAEARPTGAPVPEMKMKSDAAADPAAGSDAGGGGEPPRVREYFPETLLWQPALITDEHGKAVLPITFADSITTWRLTASASSTRGMLGGQSAPLRVFQDFFVDLDLPVSLTQNDEVSFPVAVYNYLKTPQTVKLTLRSDDWFELLDGDATRSLALQPNEVTSIKYRIRAKKIGFQPLEVTAIGSKLSDAIRRTVEIVPDGKKIEVAFTDRLKGRIAQTVEIPGHAIPDANKILVKIYPGIMSQVMEGTEGMLRLPGG